MRPGLDKYMMKLRLESKRQENQGKPPIASPDVVQTADFVFSLLPYCGNDSGQLLLAKRKTSRKEQYLVKHTYSDCAANEFVYTKLTQAMGYRMPDSVLFQLSPGEKRSYFKTEYIIGERYLNFTQRVYSAAQARECAENWSQFFSFQALYSITDEGDKLEVYLADDSQIYRVDTTDAFPLHNMHYDNVGALMVHHFQQQKNMASPLANISLLPVFRAEQCDRELKEIEQLYPEGRAHYLEPFAKIQEVSSEYIDDFLNVLCYIYPDCVGDFFKQYLKALKQQCYEYWKKNR